MSNKVRYRRKLVSDQTLNEMNEVMSVLKEKDIDTTYFGVYVCSKTNLPEYRLYINGITLKGIDKISLLSEVDLYERLIGK